MIKVTFRTAYQVKKGRKLVMKTSEFTEEHKNEAEARTRALALNWQIIKIEAL